MRKLILGAASAVALLTGGCAVHDHYVAADVGYDGYYDGYYGPYAGGYWGPDGFFLYSDGHGGYIRDNDHHFRHERFEHGNPFHADRDRDHDNH